MPYIGEIRLFAGNFAPANWAFCDGQLLAISEHDALFTLIGTSYGGDGVNTFALPDLRGRVPLHVGSSTPLAVAGGVESVTLTPAQMPAHTHDLRFAVGGTPAASPAGAYVAAAGPNLFASAVASPGAATPGAGGSQPHDNMAPFLGLNFIIALFGIFPPQN